MRSKYVAGRCATLFRGTGQTPGSAEFHMGFHFPIMPRIYMAIRKGDVSDLIQIVNRTPPIPDFCQWCTFLRNHDELTLEMVTEEDRQWMWAEYAPHPRMRLNLGIRRRLAPLLDNDLRKIKVANSLLFTMFGSPIIYYGDEIGMGDNIWLDDRNGVRTPMQWIPSSSAGFSDAAPEKYYLPVIQDKPYNPTNVNVADQRVNPGSLFNTMKTMIATHKAHKAFGRGDFEWVDVGTKSVAAFIRTYQDEKLLILTNLRNENQSIRLDIQLPRTAIDIINHQHMQMPIEFLTPYQYIWLAL